MLLVDYAAEVEPDLDSLAEAIADLLPDECDVVGQSIGTWLAAEVAQRRREQVRRVALMSTFTRTRTVSLWLSALMTRLSPRKIYRATTPRLMALACGPVGDGGNHPFLAGVANSDQKGVARRTKWQIGRDFSSRLGRHPATDARAARRRTTGSCRVADASSAASVRSSPAATIASW